MLARIRTGAERKDDGFTLIELLVVMIIIGILAAIAIPAFLSQKNKAKSTAAKSDVSTLGKELTAYFVDDGTVPTLGFDAATSTWTFGTPAVTGKLSAGNEVVSTITNANNWCVTVRNPSVDTTAAAGTDLGSATWSYGAGSFGTGLKRGACA
ncbi:MAG: type pilus assembly protein PilA [Actinomycetota bacterium]|nr:type pilus assembly protein PilA [Actinomycetota bacterium]